MRNNFPEIARKNFRAYFNFRMSEGEKLKIKFALSSVSAKGVRYVFSALGFYPVAPGSAQYSFGSPLIKSAQIKLENGKTIFIEAKNQSEKNIYVQKIFVNGKEWKENYFLHSELMSGAIIVCKMGAKPKK